MTCIEWLSINFRFAHPSTWWAVYLLTLISGCGGTTDLGGSGGDPYAPGESDGNTANNSCAEVVAFEDPGLEQAALEAVRSRHPEATEVRTVWALEVTELDAFREPALASLKGLECFENLVRLSIPPGTVSDLRPLRTLTRLRSLNLYDNDISDLRPLLHLNQGALFGLSGNPIVSLEGLPLSEVSCATYKLEGVDLPSEQLQPFCRAGHEVRWGPESAPQRCNDPCVLLK